jgi:hypothetical protein
MSERERKWLIEPNTRAEGTTELIVRAGPWTTGEFVVPAAEADRLREAIKRHRDELDEAARSGTKRDRDDVDNDLYNAALGDTPDE